MAFDYKKEYKEFYLPKAVPTVVDVPSMNYIAISGCGNPNEVDGEYQRALGILYPVVYTLKMSYKTDYRMDGFFEYVVPPLESLWWIDKDGSNDFTDKSAFKWIAMIRLPDFVKSKDVEWAKDEVRRKKEIDCSSLDFFNLQEGLCVQIMHIGPYDAEPASLAAIDRFIESNDYVKDITASRRHHEIYLSDPRKCLPDKIKTVLRVPVIKKP
ncbi:MAG: GyrI-like domain-containing protein [Prevotella sp.]|nr:GyrI-like domain-containing protein [Prevotella sp.]